MSKSIDEYLKILYQNIDSLSEKEKHQYKKDREFISNFYKDFNSMYDEYIENRDEMGEIKYTTAVLQMCKEEFDIETKITKYVQIMFDNLDRNSYISENFDDFIDIIRFERNQEEKSKDFSEDKSPIEISTVFDLTEKFLDNIDKSEELVAEFRKLKDEGKIIVYSNDDKGERSVYNYKYGTVNFVFDGTANSAKTLVHEFMHHLVKIKANPNINREESSIFTEFESIYYEIAFTKFMNEQGFLTNGEESINSSRLKSEYDKDLNNCLLILLELCRNLKNNEMLEKENIINVFENYMPNITNRDELWQKGSDILLEYLQKHPLILEIINGPVTYRFNTGLAMQTNLDQITIENIYKLSELIKSKDKDDIFMRQYKLLMNQQQEKSLKKSTIDAGEIEKVVLSTGVTVEEMTNAYTEFKKQILSDKEQNRQDEQNVGKEEP